MDDKHDSASKAKPQPADLTDEQHGQIKRPQQTDATMKELDMPRGSASEARRRSHGAR